MSSYHSGASVVYIPLIRDALSLADDVEGQNQIVSCKALLGTELHSKCVSALTQIPKKVLDVARRDILAGGTVSIRPTMQEALTLRLDAGLHSAVFACVESRGLPMSTNVRVSMKKFSFEKFPDDHQRSAHTQPTSRTQEHPRNPNKRGRVDDE